MDKNILMELVKAELISMSLETLILMQRQKVVKNGGISEIVSSTNDISNHLNNNAVEKTQLIVKFAENYFVNIKNQEADKK